MDDGSRDVAVEFGEDWPCQVPFLAPAIESIDAAALGGGQSLGTCITFVVPALRAVARGHVIVGRPADEIIAIVRRATRARLPLVLWAQRSGDIRHPVSGRQILVGDLAVLGEAEAA